MQILKKYWKDFAIFWGLFVIFVGGIFFFFYLVSDGKAMSNYEKGCNYYGLRQ